MIINHIPLQGKLYTHLLFPRLQHPPSIFRTISLQYILLSNESMLALSNHDYISNFRYQNKCHIIIIICKQDCITQIENLSHLKSPYTISHLSLQLVSFFGKDECPLEFTTCNLPPFGCGKLKLVYASLPSLNLWWILPSLLIWN